MAVKDQSICAPADGVIESIDLPQNTIVIKTSPVNTLAIKVCVGTVSFERMRRFSFIPVRMYRPASR